MWNYVRGAFSIAFILLAALLGRLIWYFRKAPKARYKPWGDLG